MTSQSKTFRLAIALGFIFSTTFSFVSSAQSDPRYQYKQLTSGTPTKTPDAGAASPNVVVADRTTPPLTPTQKIPFDGGLSLFVLAGAGIAAKKRYDKKKAAV